MSFLFGTALLLAPVRIAGTALDDYVALEDPNFGFNLVDTLSLFGATVYVLNMTSQQWRSSNEADRTLWTHWVSIIVPSDPREGMGALFIDGGNNGDTTPQTDDEILSGLALLAVSTRTVIVDLQMVPNQPLTFAGEASSRSEDAILAYSFDQYLRTNDETWPALLPMVKSAVRAMDAAQLFLPTISGPSINSFIVAGNSKRGWTTWLTGAVDTRVVAIAPLVFELLNMDEQLNHQLEVYGLYPDPLSDYVDLGVFDRFDLPEGQALMDIIDPYEYRSRFADIPKYLINSTGDQFYPPDSSQFYFGDLPGTKYLRYVPNTDHSLAQAFLDVVVSLAGFYHSLTGGPPLPEFTWTVEECGSTIRVVATDQPASVNLWQATNPTARDFRLETIGPAWTSSTLVSTGDSVYLGQVSEPVQGWTAFFVELVYENEGFSTQKFTTEVRVIPDTLPFQSSSVRGDHWAQYE